MTSFRAHLLQAIVQTAGAVLRLRTAMLCGVCASALLVGAAQAQDRQQALFEQMLSDPLNHDITWEFVRQATENADYEAAIGALERLLVYNPAMTRVKYELGALYFRMGSFEMAKRYFQEALKSPDLSPVTRARIETYLPDAEKQVQQSRFSGFLSAGVRYQSNASFAPASGLIQLGGQQFALLPTVARQSDWNWYGILGLSHDYDFNNQRGDLFETRFVGYGTHQFRLTELDVGLFDLSLGPRLALAPGFWPDATIKPYVVAGKAWIGGSNYLGTAGAGVGIKLPVLQGVTIGPEFEWRRAQVDSGNLTLFSGFGSGNWYTAGLATTVSFSRTAKLDARALYRRGDDADLPWQNFHQWIGEAAMKFEFMPPFEMISRHWWLAPFVRVIYTDFSAPNPFIDPLIVRTDREWTVGWVFNAAISDNFAFSTTVQYQRTDSTIQNFRQDNLSMMFGPTARF